MRKQRLLTLLLALPGCTDTYTPEPDPGYGELGVGVFLYECANISDPACIDGGSVATSFPARFAVGGRFSLRYDWRDSDEDHFGDPLPQIQTAAPTLLASSAGTLTGLVPGYAAVLAVTGNSEVVDLRHLQIADVDALQIVPAAEPLSLALVELEVESFATLELEARPVDSDGIPLSGILAYEWTAADPAVLEVVTRSYSGRVSINAGAPGQTTLTVTQGEHTTQIVVTVTDELPTTGSSGDTVGSTGDTDASDSSGDTLGSTGDATGTTGDATGSTGGDSSGDSSGSGSSGSTGGAL